MIDVRKGTTMDDSPFGHKKLRIWHKSRALVRDIHAMSLEKLPKFELYEEGSQIRRSIKSVKTNIVEGFGRRRYKAEYIRYLEFAYASSLESLDHLETLFDTNSLQDEDLFREFEERLIDLSKSIYLFIKGVERDHDPDRT
jgi:four helix bundle protein